MDIKSQNPTLKFLIGTKYVSYDDPGSGKPFKDPDGKLQNVENKSAVYANGKILEDFTDDVQNSDTTHPIPLDTKPDIKQLNSMFCANIKTEDLNDDLQISAHKPSPLKRTKKSSPEIRPKEKMFSSILSDIINVCEKQVCGQTSSVQKILNACSKLMNLPGSDELCNDINSACNEILTETYRNSHVIIDLCEDLSNIRLENFEATMKEPSKSNPSATNFSASTRNPCSVATNSYLNSKNFQPFPTNSDQNEAQEKVDISDHAQDFDLAESYLSSKNSQPFPTLNSDQNEAQEKVTISDHTLKVKQEALSSESNQKADDFDMISCKDEDDGNMDSDDPDWEPELEEIPKCKQKKYIDLKNTLWPNKDTLNGQFQCSQCPEILNTLRAYERHQYDRHTKITCEICSAEILGKNIDAHMKMHSGEKTAICHICGAAFLDKVRLKSHMLIHTDEKPFKCERCDYTCKSKVRLRVHMICHSSARKFQCEECGSCFPRNNDLKRHISRHKNIWPFSCIICGKKFKTKACLSRHENIHTNIFLHECKVCGKKIRQQGNLKIHMRTHNGEKPYKCEICSLGFAHNVTRKHHQQSCGK